MHECDGKAQAAKRFSGSHTPHASKTPAKFEVDSDGETTVADFGAESVMTGDFGAESEATCDEHTGLFKGNTRGPY